MYFFVIPAKAQILLFQLVVTTMGPGFHRSDDFLREHQILLKGKRLRLKKVCIITFFPIHEHFVFIIISLQAGRQRQAYIH